MLLPCRHAAWSLTVWFWGLVLAPVAILRGADAIRLGEAAIKVDESQSTCNNTVVYAFLASRGLPLEKVWAEYFKDCPSGSYAVFIHSQQMVQPPLIPESTLVAEPLQGNPRFKYDMVEMMLKLYREAAHSMTPNGCRPRWVQMLSDSCAPIRSCSDNHKFLAARAGSSFVGDGDEWPFDTPVGERRKPKPWPEKYWYKASQWTTLWMPHVRMLLSAEADNYPGWKDAYCPDEHYTANILTQFNASINRSSLTFSEFVTDIFHKLEENSHPNVIGCNTMLPPENNFGELEDVDAHFINYRVTPMPTFHKLVKKAHLSGKRFMRKFASNCTDQLLNLITRHEY